MALDTSDWRLAMGDGQWAIGGQRVCKPGFVHISEEMAVIIHLGCPLPNTSCNLPGRRPENRAMCRLYLVLLPAGFTLPLPLPAARCALTAPFHPYPIKRRFAFCGTFPEVASAGRYPAPCFRGARTFLPCKAGAITRPSDRKPEYADEATASRF